MAETTQASGRSSPIVLARLSTRLRSLAGRVSINARRLGLTTIALGFSGSTTLCFNLVLVRILSPGAYGDVARTFSLGMAVAQLTMAGIAPAIAREVAHGHDDATRFARARGGIRTLAYTCGSVSLLYFPLAFAGVAPTGVVPLAVGWALALVYSLYFGLKMMLFVLNWSTRYAALELTSDAVFFLTLAALALLAPSAAVMTFSIAYILFVIATTLMIHRRGATTQRLRVDRRILTYTGWASVATYSSVGRFAIAVAVTGTVAGSADAGRFAALLAIIMPFFLLPQAAAVLTFADVARARASRKDPGLPVRFMCRISAWVSALIILTCCLFGQDVVRLALGPSYRSATASFLVLIVCVAPQIAALPAGQALAAQGAVLANAICAVTGFLVMLLGILILVPGHGVLGAAIAFGASMIVSGASVLYLAHLQFNVGLRELTGTAVALIVGPMAAACADVPVGARAGLELLILASAAGLGVSRWRRWRPSLGA